ncbi:methyl-accepting chemotaxis protein [Marinobacter sp. CA1]|uniref:methyl-accepting chemotaxis protein n=1 Tax=Marinobacter sp. CA1 TaxID=2817656 RepID=UPI001D06F0B9|nr:methyl-accepting chemotaxis protein [Marinobacter sp. CA1]UDL05970.1 methyl-accepting chemotaxis protein [Marinobacter sp. CA1]
MKALNHLSMQGKLILLVLPALLVILYFAINNILTSRDELSKMQQLDDRVRLVGLADPLIAALQKERGRSAVAFASSGDLARQAKQNLDRQRQETDLRLQEYNNSIRALLAEAEFDRAVNTSIREVEQQLKDLPNLRQQVDQRSIAASESGRRYTGLIMGMINRIPLIVRRASTGELARQVNAYFALAEAAEYAGRERAGGASLIRSGRFDLARLQQVAELAGRQQAYLTSVQSMLPSDSPLRDTIAKLDTLPASQELARQRQTLFANAAGLTQLTAAGWFDTTTERIEVMNTDRQVLLDNVRQLADQSLASARNNLLTASVLAAAAVLAVLVLMLLTIRTINRQVGQLLSGIRFAMDQKDLTRPIDVASRDEMGAIGTAINELFQRFGQALLQIDKASIQLATSTEQTSSTADQSAAQVRQQQQQIEQVAAATEEMTATSEDISRNTQQVADAAQRAREKSRDGDRVLQESMARIHSLARSVQEVNAVIDTLEKRSQSISEVVEVIRQVAEQTNLLALNAAIEAARAGEHGRGFAVVADEVRALARQTHESTTKIEDIVGGFRDITSNAGQSIATSHRLANETSEQASNLEQTFADILNDVSAIADMANQIATASEEQVAVTRELAGSMEQVREAANLTFTGSQEITQVTGEQARLSRQLQDLANDFKVPAQA